MASDHNLCIAMLNLKLKKMQLKGSSKKFDVKLKIPEIKAVAVKTQEVKTQGIQLTMLTFRLQHKFEELAER